MNKQRLQKLGYKIESDVLTEFNSIEENGEVYLHFISGNVFSLEELVDKMIKTNLKLITLFNLLFNRKEIQEYYIEKISYIKCGIVLNSENSLVGLGNEEIDEYVLFDIKHNYQPLGYQDIQMQNGAMNIKFGGV